MLSHRRAHALFSHCESEGIKMALTGAAIKQLIQNSDNVDDFCEKLAQAIVDNIEIRVPAGTVIIQVTGQAAGAPNPAPIPCEVS